MSKKNILIIGAYILFATACILCAVFYQGIINVSILGFPYELVSLLIVTVGKGNTFNDVLGWILYVIFSFGLIALPIISIIKKKKISLSNIFFIIFVLFNAFALYVFINPTLFLNSAFFANETTKKAAIEVVKTNVAFVSYLLLILTLVIYLYKNMKNMSNKSFKYSKGAIFALLGFIVFYVFYAILQNTISTFKSANSPSTLWVFNNILNTICLITPFVFNSIVLIKILKLLNSSDVDMFDDQNEKKIKDISKWIFIYLIVTIACEILRNVLSLIFNKVFSTLHASFNIDLLSVLLMFLFGCLLIFFKKSSEIKQENDLTI